MLSLFTSLIAWVFRLSTIKFVVFGALALLLGPLMELVMSLVDATGLADIDALFATLPESILYYLAVFRLDYGVPVLISAMLVKFFIRRLPVVG
jgi:hypothetical protein